MGILKKISLKICEVIKKAQADIINAKLIEDLTSNSEEKRVKHFQ